MSLCCSGGSGRAGGGQDWDDNCDSLSLASRLVALQSSLVDLRITRPLQTGDGLGNLLVADLLEVGDFLMLVHTGEKTGWRRSISEPEGKPKEHKDGGEKCRFGEHVEGCGYYFVVFRCKLSFSFISLFS